MQSLERAGQRARRPSHHKRVTDPREGYRSESKTQKRSVPRVLRDTAAWAVKAAAAFCGYRAKEHAPTHPSARGTQCLTTAFRAACQHLQPETAARDRGSFVATSGCRPGRPVFRNLQSQPHRAIRRCSPEALGCISKLTNEKSRSASEGRPCTGVGICGRIRLWPGREDPDRATRGQESEFTTARRPSEPPRQRTAKWSGFASR